MNQLSVRIIANIALMLCVITLPWWMSLTILIICIVVFDFFIEALCFGFIFDTMYGHGRYGLYITSLLLAVSMYIKPKIRI